MPISPIVESDILSCFPNTCPDIFAIARMRWVFGPHKELIEAFCKEVLTRQSPSGYYFQISDVNQALQRCKKEGHLKQCVENLLCLLPVTKYMPDTACSLAEQPTRLLFAILARCQHGSSGSECVDRFDLIGDACWCGLRPNLDVIAEPLEKHALVVKDGNGWRLLVMFHLFMPDDWIQRHRDSHCPRNQGRR